MQFVANLRQETIQIFAEHATELAAYLLSAHRVTPATLQAAGTIRALGLPLFADNGTKPLIEDVIAAFEPDARQIRLAVASLRRQLGHVPRGREVPEDLRTRAAQLAAGVVERATALSEAVDSSALLDSQLVMNPTDLIAQEDFATGCIIGLGLERETTGWSVADVDRRNRRSIRLWRRVAGDPRCAPLRVYAVLSAMDYNTARSAGRMAGAAGVTNVSIGIAGITLDGSATDFVVFRTSTLLLEKPVPRRYVRLAQVLRGISDGYADTGKTIERFHCLGLGAPSMFPIAAAALAELTDITLDATSPIHDATRDRVLYDPEEEGSRTSTRAIVEHILGGGAYAFLSPFTRRFRDSVGHHPDLARAAWQALGRPVVTEQLLETPSDLTAAVPLFSEGDPVQRGSVVRTRIAHNHWVLGRLSESFPDRRGRRARALSAIERLVSGPPTVTTRGLTIARHVLTREG
jgi:hypothetical protein